MTNFDLDMLSTRCHIVGKRKSSSSSVFLTSHVLRVVLQLSTETLLSCRMSGCRSVGRMCATARRKHKHVVLSWSEAPRFTMLLFSSLTYITVTGLLCVRSVRLFLLLQADFPRGFSSFISSCFTYISPLNSRAFLSSEKHLIHRRIFSLQKKKNTALVVSFFHESGSSSGS